MIVIKQDKNTCGFKAYYKKANGKLVRLKNAISIQSYNHKVHGEINIVNIEFFGFEIMENDGDK